MDAGIGSGRIRDGDGDWGRDWALRERSVSPIPNPQSLIPNSSAVHTGTAEPSSRDAHSRDVTSPQAPAACRHVWMRWTGVSASKGSHAAPLAVMPAWAISRSAPRGIHSPTIRPAAAPALDQRRGERLAEPVQFAVGHRAPAPDQRRMIGLAASRRPKDVGKALVPEQIGACGAAEYHEGIRLFSGFAQAGYGPNHSIGDQGLQSPRDSRLPL